MKICHIITTFEMGGAQLSTLRLLKELSKTLNYEIFLIHGEGGPLEKEFYSLSGIRIIKISSLKREINPALDFLSFIRIFQLLKKHKIDLVHTHCSKPSFLGRMASILSKIKTLHTYHGFGHEFYFHPASKKIFLFCERILNYFSDAIIFVCSHNLKKSLKLKLSLPKNSYVVPDFLNFEEYKKERKTFKNIRIGSILSFKEQKNPFKIVEIFQMIQKKHSKAEFFMIGEGPLRKKTENYVKKLGMHSVYFPGAVLKIDPFFNQMSLFVGASRFEGLSMAELECLFFNIPMVITRAGGIKEIMEQGKQGFFYNFECVNEAFQCCDKILSGKFNYQPVLNDFFEIFRKNVVLSTYDDLYKRLTSSYSST